MKTQTISISMRKFWIIVILFLFGSTVASLGQATKIPFLIEENAWSDSVLQILSPEEGFCQLIVMPVYSNKDQVHEESISSLIREYKVGGLIYFQGGPVRQTLRTDRFQKESKIPLMGAIDAELGLGT